MQRFQLDLFAMFQHLIWNFFLDFAFNFVKLLLGLAIQVANNEVSLAFVLQIFGVVVCLALQPRWLSFVHGPPFPFKIFVSHIDLLR